MARSLDVADWLAGLGLGDYAAAFAANDIDADLLPGLTADDLREIGVASVGHRRRILSAAAALADGAPPPPATAAAAPPEGERRVVTVLYCDLVGSTGLATRLDPEDFRTLLARYRRELEAAATPFGGEVVQFLGDGALVFFGHHRLHEHDAESAVAAALEIVRRVRAMAPFAGATPDVRIGVATGLTVVGGGDADRPLVGDHAVGEASNLAARLQALAAPGAVVVADATRSRIGALFEFEDLGRVALKGFEAPVEAWRVLGHGDRASRFEALRLGGRAAAFVGRDAEIARLRTQFALARRGRRRISLVVGESGLGKSRLVRQALEAEGQDPARQPVLQCAPYHAGTPFHPIRYYLGKRLRLAEAGAPEAQRAKLEGLLVELGLDGPFDLALLAELMRIDAGDAAALAALGSHERRARMLGLITRLMTAVAGPAAALVIEDAHWIDPSTAEALAGLLVALEATPAHVIVTMRPGPRPDWLPEGATQVIALDRLGEAALAPLVRAVASVVAPGLEIPDAVADAIAARCDGSPVFVEEITRVYLEGLADGRDLDAVLAGLPATLADSLVARLDRLTVGRRLALVAAVIGSEFPVALLREVADLPEAEARAGVAELLEAGVLQIGHSPFGEALAFRHMLLRDAAYRILLRADRAALHARIAGTLRARFPRIAEVLPQVVAVHLAEAGDAAGAAAEWERAGALAAERSAYAEAAGHFERAAEACALVEPPGAEADRELACRLGLMSALIASRGFNGAGVAEAQARIERLGRETGATPRLISMLHARWIVLGAAGDFSASLDLARQLHRMTEAGSDVDRLLGDRVLGTSLLFQGRLAEARAALMRFVERYDPERHEAALRAIGVSSHAVMSMVGLAEIEALFENFGAADAWRDRARALAEAGGRGHDICNATLFLDCVVPALQRRFDRVAAGAARLRAHAFAFDLEVWRGHADLFEGTAALWRGARADGLAAGRRGVNALRDSLGFLSFCFLFYADACLEAGEPAEAATALSLVGPAWGETWLAAERERLRAQLALAEGGAEADAVAMLDSARAIAERQGAALFAARIRADLAAPRVTLLAPADAPTRSG